MYGGGIWVLGIGDNRGVDWRQEVSILSRRQGYQHAQGLGQIFELYGALQVRLGDFRRRASTASDAESCLLAT